MGHRSTGETFTMAGFTEACPSTAPFFGFMGAAAALIFANFGAAYGTAKSGVGVASMGVMRPDLVMRSIIPVVMAGVIGIYGLIIAVITQTKITTGAGTYSLYNGFAHLAGGPRRRSLRPRRR